MIELEYKIKINGVSRYEAIESMSAILDTYLDDLARCFDVEFSTELMTFNEVPDGMGKRGMRVQGMPVQSKGFYHGKGPVNSPEMSSLPGREAQ